MEKQLVFYVFVLLLVQSCHVQAQRPLSNVFSSVADAEPSSVSSKGDSYKIMLLGKPKPSSTSSKDDLYETLLLDKPSSTSSKGDSYEALLLGKPKDDLYETLLLDKPSSMSSKGDSYEALLLGKPSAMSSKGDSYETLLLGKPSSTNSKGDSNETLLLDKPSSTNSKGDSYETLLLDKPSSPNSKGDSYETLLLGKPSSTNSEGDLSETLLLGKPSSMSSKGDSYETPLLGKPPSSTNSEGDLYETLLLGKPSSMSSKGDSYETLLLLGLYIAFVGMVVAKLVFEIVQKVSALAKASRAEEKQSSKLKSMDIEMGVEPEAAGSAKCKPILYSPEVVKEATQDISPKSYIAGSVYRGIINGRDAVKEAEAEYNSICKPILYSPEVIKEATHNFSPKSHIEGSTYRGIIDGRDVVIKQMKGDVSHEMKSLQKVEHDNLVKLQGFCMNCEGKSYLIYEYVENGSLNLWLHRPSVGFQGLTWRTRLQIALDVATGLNHIHERTGIVHRALKSSNVLLNRKLRAKIANFGAARYIVNPKIYMSPEYGGVGVSPKIDVLAFGVILLELISGKKAMIKDGELRLLWTQIKYLLEGQDREEKLRKWIDPNVQETCSIDSAMSMALMAKACLDEDVEARPTMGEIVYRLSNLLDVCFEHLECS